MSSFPRVSPIGFAKAPALVVALVAALLVVSTGCAEKAPIEQARELMAQGKKGDAVKLLEQMHQKDPKAYEPVFMLAQAAEEREDWEAVVVWYEKALALPEGQRSEKLLKQQMHPALVAQAKKQSAFPDKYEAMLQDAAKLEADLRMADTPANEALFSLYKVGFEAAVKSDRYDDAIATAEKMDKLYFDRDKIREYTKQKKELQKKQFFHAVEKVFDDKIKPDLLQTGRFDTNANAIALSYTFTVPAPQEGGLFDPQNEEFLRQVQYAACWAGLRDQYAGLLNEWAKASPVGRELKDEHVNAFFNKAMQDKQPTWDGAEFDPAGAHKESAEGLKMICAGSLPVPFVVDNMRKVKLMFEKEAKEGVKAGDEKAADEKAEGVDKAGDEKAGDEKAGDEKAGDDEKAGGSE